jgi:cytochrome c553
MAKLGIFVSLATLVVSISLASWSAPSAHAGAPCTLKEFKTEGVKAACEKGGQAAAKDYMKSFMKEAKLKSCNACHAKLAPKYELKKDGLEQYKKLGGK